MTNKNFNPESESEGPPRITDEVLHDWMENGKGLPERAYPKILKDTAEVVEGSVTPSFTDEALNKWRADKPHFPANFPYNGPNDARRRERIAYEAKVDPYLQRLYEAADGVELWTPEVITAHLRAAFALGLKAAGVKTPKH